MKFLKLNFRDEQYYSLRHSESLRTGRCKRWPFHPSLPALSVGLNSEMTVVCSYPHSVLLRRNRLLTVSLKKALHSGGEMRHVCAGYRGSSFCWVLLVCWGMGLLKRKTSLKLIFSNFVLWKNSSKKRKFSWSINTHRPIHTHTHTHGFFLKKQTAIF